MQIATLEIETVYKNRDNFRHIFTMLFFEFEQALSNFEHTTKYKDMKMEQIGTEDEPQYFCTGYDTDGNFVSASIFKQKVYK